MAYLTTEEFKDNRGIESGSDDGVIGDCIADAQAWIESYTNRKFEGTAANRLFDAVADVEGSILWVYNAGDLASIVTVTNGNGDVVSASSYSTIPRNAVARGKPIIGLQFKTNTSAYWRTASNGVAEDAITINGIWAYSATPPADIVRATKMLAGFYYDNRASLNAETMIVPGVSVRIPTGVPAAVKQILINYVRESY